MSEGEFMWFAIGCLAGSIYASITLLTLIVRHPMVRRHRGR